MSDEMEQAAHDTTERESDESFEDWNFNTGLPDEDALQRMCRDAAKLAVAELVKDISLSFSYRHDRMGVPQGPDWFELLVHAWDGRVTIGRPFMEVVTELAQDHTCGDGGIDDDDPKVLEVIAAFEAATAMLKSRLRPRKMR
jgi:hypothetical protein